MEGGPFTKHEFPKFHCCIPGLRVNPEDPFPCPCGGLSLVSGLPSMAPPHILHLVL